jgi:hypothetical protein
MLNEVAKRLNKGPSWNHCEDQAIQKLDETRIEVDEKVIAGEKLPKTMILYIMDIGHFIIAAKPLKTLEESALTKANVEVASQKNKYTIKLPPNVYNFYHLDENDYTIMASDKDPKTIIIAI